MTRNSNPIPWPEWLESMPRTDPRTGERSDEDHAPLAVADTEPPPTMPSER